MKVKDQILEGMKLHQLSVCELARSVGVSNQSVRMWINGDTAPRRRHLPAVEKALGRKLDMSRVPPDPEHLSDQHPEIVNLLRLDPDAREGMFCILRQLPRKNPKVAMRIVAGALNGALAAIEKLPLDTPDK